MPSDNPTVDTPVVRVLNAGVLHHFVEKGLIPALRHEPGLAVQHASGPSVRLARELRDGQKQADVFLSADAQVNTVLARGKNGALATWNVTFAGNEVVLVYSPKSRFADAFQSAGVKGTGWHELLLTPGVRLVRGDPDEDPLAYYTVLVMKLAELHYGTPDLKQRVLGDDRNAEQMAGLSFSGLETGEIDALFMYRSLALDRQLPYVPLPDAVNLGNPKFAAAYQRVSYTTTDGERFVGGPIGLSATVLANAANPHGAIELIGYLLGPAGQRLVRDYHFGSVVPTLSGDRSAVPDRLTSLVGGP
jgi:molybdate/tungstate transport system substrate-binding protein